jgi:hypothetical protein
MCLYLGCSTANAKLFNPLMAISAQKKEGGNCAIPRPLSVQTYLLLSRYCLSRCVGWRRAAKVKIKVIGKPKGAKRKPTPEGARVLGKGIIANGRCDQKLALTMG